MRWLLALLLLLSDAQASAAISLKTIRERHVPPTPNPVQLLAEFSPIEVWALGIIPCMAVKPMLSSVLKRRELTLKEAYEAIAGCFLPIVGGLLVHKYFPDEWNNLPMRRFDLDLGIGSQS